MCLVHPRRLSLPQPRRSRACRHEGSAKAVQRLQHNAAVPAATEQLRLVGLSGAAADCFNAEFALHATPLPIQDAVTPVVSIRLRVGLSWLSALPQQVLQALREVLPQQRYHQILAACLLQPGACCGQLGNEWRAIATVLLAWAMYPSSIELDSADTSQAHTRPQSPPNPDAGTTPAAVAAVQLINGGSRAQFGSPVATEPTTEPTPAAHESDDIDDANMDLATPETCKTRRMSGVRASGPAPVDDISSLPFQQQTPTPGSAYSDMSMSMSINTASGIQTRGMTATPMSVSTVRLASRLGQQQPGFTAEQRLATLPAGQHQGAESYFPTLADSTTQTASEQQQHQQEHKAVPQLQQDSPQSAWEQLLGSQESRQLLQALPCLRPPQQSAVEGASKQHCDGTAEQHPQQQQRQQQQQSLQGMTEQHKQQHRQELVSVLHALHSVYEDCKLAKLRLYLLQLLGPLLWTLAGWIGASSYQEHYERDASPTSLEQASRQLCKAVESFTGKTVHSTGDSAVLYPYVTQQEPEQQQQRRRSGSAGNDDMSVPPGDIIRCLSELLSASGKHQRYMPYLACKGSSCVRRSCQLIEAYQLLSDCASKCAAAAATAAAQLSDKQQLSKILAGFTGLSHLASSDSSSSADADQALAAELQHILLQSSQQLVLLLVKQGWDVLAVADALPLGVALPIQEAVARCRTNPPPGWPIMAYALIGREDVAATLASNDSAAAAASCTSGILVSTKSATSMPHQLQHLLLPYEQRLLLPSSSCLTGQQLNYRPLSGVTQTGLAGKGASASGARRSSRSVSRGLRTTAAAHGATGGVNGSGDSSSGPDGVSVWRSGVSGELGLPIDGMEGINSGVSALRFGRDDRLAEVQSLLGTNMPVVLNVPGSDTDPDLPTKQQAALLSAAIRTMALPLGRGAFTLGLSDPLPGEHLAVPLLCLSGVVAGPGDAGAAGGRVLVNLDLTNAQPAPGGGAAADVTAWCEFHNGVASGIKLTPRRRRSHQYNNKLQQEQQQQLGTSDPSASALAADGRAYGTSSSSGADSLADSWLPHSKPVVPNYAHAGVLLALGLNGHLDRLSWTDLYRYLSDQHDATTIGVLLGMSACCRGSADTTVARMLFLHLPARHPNTFPEIELSPHVQAASLLGLGLLYQGSCHRLMTETMLEEIGRTPGVNPSLANTSAAEAANGGSSLAALMSVTQDREGYALAAGFGLGLICLGQGRNAPGLADLHLEDKLRALMDATTQPHTFARKAPSSTQPKASSAQHSSGLLASSRPQSLLDSVLGPGVVTWDPVLGEDPTGQGAAAVAAAASSLKMDADQMQQYGISQTVLEGPGVNTAVTGPAAAMALMLMYLKTGDADVAARFKVPDTTYALDHMRPDMVLLMVLGRSLVMWDGISASQEWISKQLASLLDQPLAKVLENMQSSAAAAPAASAAEGNRPHTSGQAIDWGALGLAHVHALAGACFAIGLRFAGTCNANAEAILRHHLLQLLHAKRRAPGGPNDQNVAPVAAMAAAAAAANSSGIGIGVAPGAASVGRLDKAAIENCTVVVLLSLSLVMAGSGHLSTFRLIQTLSRRAAGPLRASGEGQTPGGVAAMLSGPGVGCGNLTYGHHLAVNLSAGLLFLSAGRSSLSTSNESIAALLIALYPVWPNSPIDQRCHLQAFRHLYVLAVEPRCLQAVDVHSRQQVVVPLEITALKEGLIGPITPSDDEEQQQQQQQHGVHGLIGPSSQQQSGESWPPTSKRNAPARRAARQLLQPEQQAAAVGVQAVTPPLTSRLPVPSPAAAVASAACTGAVAAAGNAGSSDTTTTAVVNIRRQAPCLLPEHQHMVSLRVCGPRYWPLQIVAATGSHSASSSGGSSSGSWSHMYLQQRICVKKKAGSLSYTDDPSGVKSLLFKAFYCGGSSDGSTADGASSSVVQQQQSFDIVHLCNTFSADPHIQAFAQVLRAATAPASPHQLTDTPQQHQQGELSLAGTLAVTAAAAAAAGSGKSAAAFRSFCNGALYECVVEEKTVVLQWYMHLYALVHRVCAAAAAVATSGHHDSSAGWQLHGLSLLGTSCQGSRSVWGASLSLSPSLPLRDLQFALEYHNGSIAAAAAVCRTAAAQNCTPGNTPGQQPWQAEALGWLPLLQPGFCEGLWKVLQQQWRKAELLPSAAQDITALCSTSSDHSRPAGMYHHGSVLERYITFGSIKAAVAATGVASEERPSIAADIEVCEQLLGCCLALLHVPSASQVQHALQEAVHHQHWNQQTGNSEDALMHLVPVLAAKLPDASGAALVELAVAASIQFKR